MNDAWFTRDVAPLFSLFSLLAVLSVLERFAKQGRHRAAITATYQAGAGLGVVLLAAAAVAWLLGQPRYVPATLAFTGLFVGAGFVASIKDLQRIYQKAELRKTIANDI